MKKTIAIALLLGLAIAGGCGGDSGSDSSSTETATTEATTTQGGKDEGAAKAAGPGQAKGNQGPRSKAKRKVAQREGALIEDTGGAKTPAGAAPAEPEEFIAPKGGDDSIQTYGEAADGTEEEEIIAAMRSFFTAMATLDYPGVCAGLTESNRESLLLYLKTKEQQGSCETVLEGLLLAQAAPEARKAANGSVLEARVQDGNAFVLFTPEGGEPSYFVMKAEDDGWRSTSLAAGTPFDPVG